MVAGVVFIWAVLEALDGWRIRDQGGANRGKKGLASSRLARHSVGL